MSERKEQMLSAKEVADLRSQPLNDEFIIGLLSDISDVKPYEPGKHDLVES